MRVALGHAPRARVRIATPVGSALLAVALAGLAVEGSAVLATVGTARAAAVLIVAAGSVAFAWTRRVSLALALLMLYLGLLDGYLKLSTGSSVVTLVRDALLYSIVAGMLVRSQVEGRRLSLPPLSGWVIAYVAFVLVQLPNPSGGTLGHSLAGVKPHLEFVPLFFLGYLTIRDVRSLRRFVLLLLVLAAANGIAGFVQFNLSPDQFAAWGPGYAERIHGTGAFAGAGRTFSDVAGTARVRPFGLGSDIGSGGLFGVLALGGVFALASLIVRARYRLIAALFGVGAVTAIVTSQGRGVIVAGVATVLAYGVLTATSQRRLASLAGLAVSAGVAYFVITSIVASAGGDAFRYQSLAASKILQTTTSASGGRPGQLGAIATNIADYPLGAGLGTAGPAAGTAGGTAITGKLNAESEVSFLVVETGIPGMLAVIGLTVVLFALGLTRCRREPDAQARVLLAAVVSPLAGILVDYYSGPGTASVPDGPYLWFVGGVIAYWLITLPRERGVPGSSGRDARGAPAPYGGQPAALRQ